MPTQTARTPILAKLRRHAVARFDALSRLWHGLRIYELPARQIAITFDLPKLGLFAHLTLIAGLAQQLGRRGRKFSVQCCNACYSNGRPIDWFGHLFVDRDPISGPAQTFVVTRVTRAPKKWRNEQITLEGARRWFFGKYEIAPHLVREADGFATANFAAHRMLGVHYRGTDKIGEAPRVGYEAALERIQARVRLGAFERIFLATDEAGFVDFLRHKAPVPVVVQPAVGRSDSNRAMHLANDGNGLRHAEQAIVDFQLLARCHGLIKTASTLSGWSAVLNPAIAVEFLNHPNADTCYFPDRDLISAASR